MGSSFSGRSSRTSGPCWKAARATLSLLCSRRATATRSTYVYMTLYRRSLLMFMPGLGSHQ